MSKRYYWFLGFLLLFSFFTPPLVFSQDLVSLKNLSWEEQKNRTRIILETSRPLQYNVTASQTTAEIQFESTNLDIKNLPQELFINTAEVISLRTSPLTPGQKARIVVKLTTFRPHQVSTDGNKVYIDISGDGKSLEDSPSPGFVEQVSKERPVIVGKPQVNTVPAEPNVASDQENRGTAKTAKAPVKEASLDYGPATMIQDVQISAVSGDQVDVLLVGNGFMDYEVFELTNPSRLVIDVKSVSVGPGLAMRQEPGQQLLTKVRLGQFQTVPKVARAVIDLNKKVPYVIEQEGKQLRIHLGEALEFQPKFNDQENQADLQYAPKVVPQKKQREQERVITHSINLKPVTPAPVAVKPAPAAPKPAPKSVEVQPTPVRPKLITPEPVVIPAPAAVKPATVTSKPVSPAPVHVQPAPVAPQPVAPAPVHVQPAPVAPKPVTPAPVHVQPAPVAPKPVTPAPAAIQPAPVTAITPEPVAVQPAPLTRKPAIPEPAPVKPAPLTRKPATPEPVAAPVAPQPMSPAPAAVQPAPVAPQHMSPAPAAVQPAPVAPQPVTPAPAAVQPAPVALQPVTPAPAAVQPAPVAPQPVTPAPVVPVAAKNYEEPKIAQMEPKQTTNEQFFTFKPDTSVFAQETTTIPTTNRPPQETTGSQGGMGSLEDREGTEKQYTGEPFSFDFKDIDIKDLFRFIADISGLNVILDPTVRGSVTLKLTEVPWDQALDLITKNQGLGYTIEGNVIRIAPLSKIEAEEQQRSRVKEQQFLSSPLVTKIVPVSYAKANEVDQIVKRLLTKKGSSIIDRRTNTLIITDIDTNMDSIVSLIETLDSRTSQVVIETRIVETTKNFSQAFGIQWGFRGIVDPAFGNNTTLQFPNNVLVGGDVITSTSGIGGNPLGGYAVNLPTTQAPNSAVLLSAGNILDTFRLDVALMALENSGQGRILSSPKIATQNNTRAEIVQGTQIPVQTIANNTITTTYVQASLRMTVLPQITAEGTVIMEVEVENNRPNISILGIGGTPAIDTESARTTLLVEDGGTTVIGGIFTASENYQQGRTPVLHRIPLLGWLFKNTNVTRENRELLIFLTPRIIR